jgi:hypothetical protein
MRRIRSHFQQNTAALGGAGVVGWRGQRRRLKIVMCLMVGYCREGESRMNEVMIPIGSRWAKVARSRWAIVPTALSGVSVSFAPLFLYFYGQGSEPLGPPWLGMTVCWTVILLSGFFHINLSQHVLSQLRKASPSPPDAC